MDLIQMFAQNPICLKTYYCDSFPCKNQTWTIRQGLSDVPLFDYLMSGKTCFCHGLAQDLLEFIIC